MNDLGTARGSIELDFGKMASSAASAVKELQKIEQQSKQTDAEINLLQSTSNKTGTVFQQSAQKALQLASNLATAKDKVQVYEKEMAVLKTQIADSKTAQEQLTKTIADTKTKYVDAQKVVADIEKKYDSSKQALDELKKAHSDDNATLKQAKDVMKDYAAQLLTAQKSSQSYSKTIASLEKSQSSVTKEQEKLNKKIAELKTKYTDAKNSVADLSKSLDDAKVNVSRMAAEYGESAEETTKAKEAVEKYSKELDSAKTVVSSYEKQLKELEQSQSDSAKKYDELTASIEDAKKKYNEAEEEVTRLSEAYKQSRDDLEAVQAVYDANSETVQRAKEETAKYADELQKAKQKSADYGNQVGTLENQQRQLSNETAQAEENLQRFGVECTNAKADVNKLTIELSNAESFAQSFGTAMEQAGGKIEKAGEKVSSIGNGLTTKVTTPLVGAGTAMVKMAGDVEDSAAKLATIADTSVVSMDKLQTSARAVSDNTATAWTDINEAMYQYISATGDTVNASDAAGKAVKAAKAGFTDTATAIDGLTSVMNAYSMSGSDDMQLILDMMLETQNVGKTTFGELSQYIGQIAPLAYQANIPLESMFGSIATLTGSGIQTSQAITGLKAAISNIIKPTEDATDAASALGIQWDASALQQKGLNGMLEDVKAKIKEAAPEYAKLSDEVLSNNAAIINLETTNEDLATQMERVAEDSGKSSDAYKSLKEQYDANAESAKGLKKTNEGLSEQMTILADAADSPLSAYSQLFGSVEGLNSMMVLASEDGGKKWLEFTESIANSSGALDEAYGKIQQSNMERFRNSLNRLKNTAIDAGNKILPVVSDLMETVADLVQSFSELDESQQEMILKTAGITAAAGPVLSVGGKAISVIGGVTGGIGTLIKKVTEVKTVGSNVAEAAGTATEALGSKGLTGVLAGLATPGTGWAIVGATAIAGIGIACAAAYQQAIDNNLAEHFGTVKLSAQEAEEAARRITETPWTATLNLYSTATDDLNSIKSEIGTTVENINKAQWKIETGIELTDEEKQAYTEDVESFISQTKQYVEQQQYTSTLAIKTVYGDDNADTSFSDDVYGGLNEELTKLGNELSDLVNTAFEENMLNDEDTRKLIQQKEQEIQDVLDDIAQARYDVKMQNIVASIPDGSLTSDSFKEVQKQLTEQMEAKKADIEQAEMDVLVPYRVQLNRGEIDQKEYDAKVTETLLEATERMGEVDLQGIQYEIQTISGTYSEANEDAAKKYTSDLKESFQSNLDKLGNEMSFTDFFNMMEIDLSSGYSGMSETTKGAIRELLKEMEPQKEELELLAEQYKQAGQEVPDSIMQGISDIERLQAMTGSIDAAYNLLAGEVSNSPELQQAITNAYASGESVPAQLAEALQSKYPDVYDATIGIFTEMLSGEAMSHDELVSSFEALGIEMPDKLVSALSSKSGDVQSEVMELLQYVTKGYSLTYPQLEQIFSDLGVSLPDTLINELMFKESDVQAQAISLLSQIQYADNAKREELKQQLRDCGIEIDDSIIAGMAENQENVNNQADNVVAGIRSRVDGADGGTVEIKTNNPEQEASNWWTRFRNWLTGARTSVSVSAGGGIRGYATGGIVTEEQVAAVAEGDNPEAIIPLSVSQRTRALSLYEQVGNILDYNMQDTGTGNGALAEEIASRIASVLKDTPIENVIEMYLEDGDVTMDGERVGRKIAPTISRIQARKR